MQEFVESRLGASGDLGFGFRTLFRGEVTCLFFAERACEISDPGPAERMAEHDLRVDLPHQQASLGRRALDMVCPGPDAREEQHSQPRKYPHAQRMRTVNVPEASPDIPHAECQGPAAHGGGDQRGPAHRRRKDDDRHQRRNPAEQVRRHAPQQDSGTQAPQRAPRSQRPFGKPVSGDTGRGTHEYGGDEPRIRARVEKRAGYSEQPVVGLREPVDLTDADPCFINAQYA